MSPVSSQSSDESQIKILLQKYRDALVGSSTPMVMELYAPDAVLMAQTISTQLGTDAIRATYDQIFRAIHLQVEFDVLEVKTFSDDWAFARTTSAGIQKQLISGSESKEGNQELFVLQKLSGDWKIARYCFCSAISPN